MNREKSSAIADRAIAKLRKSSYEECCRLIDNGSVQTVNEEDGGIYEIETQAFWDDAKRTNIRVMVLVSCGGLTDFLPLSREFIVSGRLFRRRRGLTVVQRLTPHCSAHRIMRLPWGRSTDLLCGP